MRMMKRMMERMMETLRSLALTARWWLAKRRAAKAWYADPRFEKTCSILRMSMEKVKDLDDVWAVEEYHVKVPRLKTVLTFRVWSEALWVARSERLDIETVRLRPGRDEGNRRKQKEEKGKAK